MDCEPDGFEGEKLPLPGEDLCPQENYHFQGFWS